MWESYTTVIIVKDIIAWSVNQVTLRIDSFSFFVYKIVMLRIFRQMSEYSMLISIEVTKDIIFIEKAMISPWRNFYDWVRFRNKLYQFGLFSQFSFKSLSGFPSILGI